MTKLISKIPDGPLAQKWTKYKASVKLVNPANKKKLEIIVIGTGLSGAGASSALGELGYSVKTFCYQDSPRRAHSVAAQGGINAAKNYLIERNITELHVATQLENVQAYRFYEKNGLKEISQTNIYHFWL